VSSHGSHGAGPTQRCLLELLNFRQRPCEPDHLARQVGFWRAPRGSFIGSNALRMPLLSLTLKVFVSSLLEPFVERGQLLEVALNLVHDQSPN
jgi:hypothetical protein